MWQNGRPTTLTSFSAEGRHRVLVGRVDANKDVGGEVERNGEHSMTGTTTVDKSTNKSCVNCERRKRKCGGDGVNPCGRCVAMGNGEACVYRQRRPNPGRPRRSRPDVGVAAAAKPESCLPKQRPTSADGNVAYGHFLRQDGTHSLKRCRMSASLATGLVGSQENAFLGDYFSGVGFLPLTCPSDIREAMVAILTSSVSTMRQHEDLNLLSSDDAVHNGIIFQSKRHDTKQGAAASAGCGTSNQGPRGLVSASTCRFWCAVALGRVIRGGPTQSVTSYVRLATRALDNGLGPATTDVAKAWTMLAYLHCFLGDMEMFSKYKALSEDFLLESKAAGRLNDSVAVGFVDLMTHADELHRFRGGFVDAADLKSFCNKKHPPPQLKDAATGSEVFRYAIQSYREFAQGFYKDILHQASTTTPGACKATAAELGGFTRGKRDTAQERAGCLVVPLSGVRWVGPLGFTEKNMLKRLREFSSGFERLEELVDRPEIATGIGGIIVNGTLVHAKLVKHDMEGALERLARCVDVFARYPGICRFELGKHITHVQLMTLIVLDAQELYEKLRATYNSVRTAESPLIPPFAEWKGIEACCGLVYCRGWERVFESDEMGLRALRSSCADSKRSGSVFPPTNGNTGETCDDIRSDLKGMDDGSDGRMGGFMTDNTPEPSEAILELAIELNRARQGGTQAGGEGIAEADWVELSHAMLDHVDVLDERVLDELTECV